ncbi:MAG: DMT family transporter [Acidobacteriota bacterium]
MSFSRLDLLLLLMVVIWGSNFSLIKVALRDFPEISFNALRLVLASAVFLAAMGLQARRRWAARPRLADQAAMAPLPGPAPHSPALEHTTHPGTAGHPLNSSEWRRLVLLGLVGHLLYQLCFLAGVARTSVANSALIFGCTPVVVAIMASVAGHERLSMQRWLGAVLSFAGIYAIVGFRAALSASTLAGDALIVGGMLCWSLYSVLAQPLLVRHSPLVVTGWSMTIGTGMYLLIAIVPFAATDWGRISLLSWLLMAASALFALAFAYMVWYTAVQRIGSSRTAVYSNLTPIVAMVVGAVWLGEAIEPGQVFGAALIMAGIAVTRLPAGGG